MKICFELLPVCLRTAFPSLGHMGIVSLLRVLNQIYALTVGTVRQNVT